MAFVERDSDGNVIGIYARPQPGRAEERMDTDAPEVTAFRGRREPNPLADAIRTSTNVADLKSVLLQMIGERP